MKAEKLAAEPVAWRWGVPKLKGYEWRYTRTKTKSDAIPLYTHPAPRKPMTRDDMRKLLKKHFDNGDLTGADFSLIRAVERFHQIED